MDTVWPDKDQVVLPNHLTKWLPTEGDSKLRGGRHETNDSAAHVNIKAEKHNLKNDVERARMWPWLRMPVERDIYVIFIYTPSVESFALENSHHL